MLSSLLLFLLITPSRAATDMKCQKGEIRETTDGKISTQKAHYCFNSDKNRLISRNCQDKQCAAFGHGKKIDSSEIFAANSNPGFNLCRKLDGHPEIIEFKVDNNWYSLDRCIFKDGTYVDVGQLVKFYLRK